MADETPVQVVETKAAKALYAVVHLCHAGRIYEPGDSLTHLDEHVKRHIVEHGHAAATRPKS